MHDKTESMRLLYESMQAAVRLTNRIDGYYGLGDYKARRVCAKLWQRHWRRVTKFNERFGENLYVPERYKEQSND